MSLSNATFLALVIAAGASVSMLLAAGTPPPVVASLCWMVTVVVMVIWEALRPAYPAWRQPDGQLVNDVGHTLLGSAVGSHVGTLLFLVPASAVVDDVKTQEGWWLHALAAFVLADAVRYVQHVVTHKWTLLWRVHRLHHDPRRLVAFKTGRSHFIDRALQTACPAVPLLLGFDVSAVFWASTVSGLIGVMGHANVDVGGPLLSRVLVTPNMHRAHHKDDTDSCNYGAALAIWDVLFGTYRHTSPSSETTLEVGVSPQTPTGFLQQLAEPFVRSAYADRVEHS